MATVYSTQRTNARANPVVNNKANEMGGRVRIAHGVYEASSLASGDVIEMFTLPNGARIISGSLAHDALGSSTTLSVGHAAYTDSSGLPLRLTLTSSRQQQHRPPHRRLILPPPWLSARVSRLTPMRTVTL